MISASYKTGAKVCRIAAALLLAGCQSVRPTSVERLPQPVPLTAGEPRTDAAIPAYTPRPVFESRGVAQPLAAPALPTGRGEEAGEGDVTLRFADTDIREVVRIVLGGTLKLNYTIDPAVRGAATLDTPVPLRRSEVLPTLEMLLNQNGATLVRRGGLYSVVPLGSAEAARVVSSTQIPGSGSQVVPLHYSSARDLAKLLEPYVGEGSTLLADPLRNALVISGDPMARETLLSLVRAFDIDALAGQSLVILPTRNADPEKIAAALEKALRAESDGPLGGLVQVIPLPRANAVLVASSQPRYLDAARRFFRLTGQAEAAAERTWHVYYVQHGQSADLENLLQRAFTPRNVTSTAAPGSTAPGAETATIGTGFQGGTLAGTGGTTGTARSPAGVSSSGISALTSSTGSTPSGSARAGEATSQVPATEPLSEVGSARGEDENRIRIVANRRNNALLMYATPSEYSVIERMLRKVDIVPQQVLINATVAEVTLTDALQYGTQFYFKLANLSYTLGATPVLPTGFAGFAVSHAPDVILRALSEVTNVKVLSSPQLLVMDNEPAQLQVGKQVPILTSTSTSTLTAGAPTVNNVEYRPTGVILRVTPHISSRGSVTLDISQEVSDVTTPAANTTSDSPTFTDRLVRTRVSVHDGQTIGLAGLISDSVQDKNSGIPFLKDIPLIGTLASFQNSTRERTELLVLIKPQVIQDQRQAYDLTEDLRQQLINAAAMPQQLSRQPIRGSANPHGL